MRYDGIIDRGDEISKPYSGPDDTDLPQSVQDLPADARAQWVSVFNYAYSSCIGSGRSDSDCESEAFQIAWGVVNSEAESE